MEVNNLELKNKATELKKCKTHLNYKIEILAEMRAKFEANCE